MSLDIWLEEPRCEHCGRGPDPVYSANITHNLGGMAEAAGIYKCLWRAPENGYTHARQLIAPLRAGLAWLIENEAEARTYDSPNGWGLYVDFVPWVKRLLEACEKNPDAMIGTDR